MKVYAVAIIEKLEKTLLVRASSKVNALRLAEKAYKNSDYILTADDWKETRFKVAIADLFGRDVDIEEKEV